MYYMVPQVAGLIAGQEFLKGLAYLGMHYVNDVLLKILLSFNRLE